MPELDHTYSGFAVRLDPHRPVERINGAFRVVGWINERRAIVGNGEEPETFWITARAPSPA